MMMKLVEQRMVTIMNNDGHDDDNDRNCDFLFTCSTIIDDNTTVIPEQTFTQFANLKCL